MTVALQNEFFIKQIPLLSSQIMEHLKKPEFSDTQEVRISALFKDRKDVVFGVTLNNKINFTQEYTSLANYFETNMAYPDILKEISQDNLIPFLEKKIETYPLLYFSILKIQTFCARSFFIRKIPETIISSKENMIALEAEIIKHGPQTTELRIANT